MDRLHESAGWRAKERGSGRPIVEETVETDPASPFRAHVGGPRISFVIVCAGTVEECLAAVQEGVEAGEPEAEVLLLVPGTETAERVAAVLPSWLRVIAGKADADLTALRQQGVVMASGDVIRLLDERGLAREKSWNSWASRPVDWATRLRGGAAPPEAGSS